MTTTEEKLCDDIVTLLNSNKVVIQQVMRSQPGASLEILPGVFLWWVESLYPNDTDPRTKGASQPTAQVMWIEEMPCIGVCAVAGTESDALSAFEEAKTIITGYYPTITNRKIMYPLFPTEAKSPLKPAKSLHGVVGFFALIWQYNAQMHT